MSITRAVPSVVLLVVLVAAGGPQLLAQRRPGGPEAVIQRLIVAIYGNDIATYNAVTVEHPLRSRLTSGGRVNADRLARLKEDPDSLQIREIRPLMLAGKPMRADARGAAPDGTTGLYMVAHEGSPMIVPMVRQAGAWKVDIRWWIAMSEMATAKPSAADSPDRVIRSMLAAMLRLDRQRAARYLSDGRNLDLLFAGAPSYREPSGVLDATVEEMPLVEIGAGEIYPTPTNRMIEGGSTPDRRAYVGLFGPVEMPFVVRRISNAWRVDAEPYFVLMNR